MAAEFDASSAHSINYGDIADPGTNKLSIAFWLWNDNFSTTHGYVNKRDAHNSNDAYSFGNGYIGGDWDFQIGAADNASVAVAYAASRTESAGVWMHVAATYNGSNSAGSRMVIYVNGSALTTTPSIDANVTPGNASSSLVLGRVNSSGSFYFDGRMAEVGIWNAELTAANVASLAKAYSPSRIRPDAAIFYDPLIRTPRDRISGTSGSVGTANVIAHPRIIYPRPQAFRRDITAAVTGNPWHYYAQQRAA